MRQIETVQYYLCHAAKQDVYISAFMHPVKCSYKLLWLHRPSSEMNIVQIGLIVLL